MSHGLDASAEEFRQGGRGRSRSRRRTVIEERRVAGKAEHTAALDHPSLTVNEIVVIVRVDVLKSDAQTAVDFVIS